ncbi:hypothetical protein N9795_01975 [Candidatus Pelagibacter sp.]|nr:hypothetical protein [Candidatus Pelagibacter sp.]
MSKNSSKKNYEQLVQWLPTLGKAKLEKIKETVTFSKTDYYKKNGVK